MRKKAENRLLYARGSESGALFSSNLPSHDREGVAPPEPFFRNPPGNRCEQNLSGYMDSPAKSSYASKARKAEEAFRPPRNGPVRFTAH